MLSDTLNNILRHITLKQIGCPSSSERVIIFVLIPALMHISFTILASLFSQLVHLHTSFPAIHSFLPMQYHFTPKKHFPIVIEILLEVQYLIAKFLMNKELHRFVVLRSLIFLHIIFKYTFNIMKKALNNIHNFFITYVYMYCNNK